VAAGVAGVIVGKALYEGRIKLAGVTLVQYTDVARDGMFTGVDAAGAAALQAEAGVAVVASGGVAGLDDIRACVAAGVAGVIVGKALYEGRIKLAEAVALSKEKVG
jgi:phosphoribosylformimino-5-aminoimidazole carboxamide ribotide isomerase